MTKVNIFEIVNYGRRESLIALVPDGLAALVNRLHPPRPTLVAHWEPVETFAVEQLAAAMPAADAEEFVKLFLSNVRWQGWTMLVWRG
jgi:hypothetical protein